MLRAEMQRNYFVVFIITFGVLGLTGLNLISAQFCNNTAFSANSNLSCPEGLTLAVTHMRTISTGEKLYSHTCCDTQEAVKQAKRDGKACKTTDCLVDHSKTPCSTLEVTIIEGVEKAYEEVLLDECDLDNSSHGFSSVCCLPNSPGALLLSAYGAENNEFPHQARLMLDTPCGGSVYNKDFIITAAHCLTDLNGQILDPANVTVVLGTNLGNLKSKSNEFQVEKVIVDHNFSLRAGHPELALERNQTLHGSRARIYNDIALLKLKRSIDFQNRIDIKSLPIAPANFTPSDWANQVVIAGWGTTDTLTVSQHLQKANLVIRDNTECFKPWAPRNSGAYFEYGDFSNQLMCIGGNMKNVTSPTAGGGDSGGPTICKDKDGYATLCGIISFGRSDENCRNDADGSSCTPSVSASVSYFREWILENGGDQDPTTFHKVYLYGQPVHSGKYLHHVHITTNDGHSCGGTLISSDTVITAGHCVFNKSKELLPGLKITVGMENFYQETNPSNVFTPSQNGVYKLDTFAPWKGLDSINRGHRMLETPYVDNIAIIKLAGNVSILPEFIPKLPSSDPIMGDAVEVSYHVNSDNFNGTLMQRDFNVLSTLECKTRLDRFKLLGVQSTFNTTKVFCGVEKYSGGSICDRELGGGLLCQGETGEETLCGIQTFRMCDLSLPNAFLNVYAFIPFITRFI